ncbi:Uncharacterised protein [uncultured archaeon]|nr:Uncharacterised protein [uncultured archaeon]
MALLNHHSASILPYICLDGTVHFILEKKSADYRPPFFDTALNFLGGNFDARDKSPEDTLEREVLEEFWSLTEEHESLNALLCQKFLPVEARVDVRLPEEIVGVLSELGPRLLVGHKLAGSYIMTVHSPIANPELTYGSTIFMKALSAEDYAHFKLMIELFSGRLTTDSWKHGSSVVDVSLKDINGRNLKFAWGYDKVINELLKANKLPEQPSGVIRPLGLVDVASLECPADIEKTEMGVPTYAGLSVAHKYK